MASHSEDRYLRRALLREIEILQTEKIDEYELEKIKNKFEANTLFGELNVMNKAMNLGFYNQARMSITSPAGKRTLASRA